MLDYDLRKCIDIHKKSITDFLQKISQNITFVFHTAFNKHSLSKLTTRR